MRGLKKYMLLLVLLFLIAGVEAQAQDRLKEIRTELEKLAQSSLPGLNQDVEIAASEFSLEELLKGIAVQCQLNIDIESGLNIYLNNTLSQAKAIDIIMYLCDKYDLEVKIYGSILSFIKYQAPEEVKPTKPLKIAYNAQGDLLSFTLENDTLGKAIQKITELSSKTVILATENENDRITIKVVNKPFKEALELLALKKALSLEAKDSSTFILKVKPKSTAKESASQRDNLRNNRNNKNSNKAKGELAISVDEAGTVNQRINFEASNIPIAEIISKVSLEADVNYFLYSEPKGVITASAVGFTYLEFLEFVLTGTDYTYNEQEGVYMIGERKLERLRDTKIFKLENRSVDTVVAVIPQELKEEVELITFPELNSVIVSGSEPAINEIAAFIEKLDQVVPMILIEVMVIDINDTKAVETGLTASIGEPKQTSGQIFPGVNMTVGANSVNNFLTFLEGFGSFNLGRVAPGFSLSLKAMESDGYLKVKSTPKLSTLNGHNASMSIGQTRYYLESTTNIIGSQNPQTVVTQEYKQSNADLSIDIRPVVSGDEQVTLDINVELSNFTSNGGANAPPETASRQFSSLVRVKNQEMIVLGGLEESELREEATGVPVLSRIPVLKWFFSSRNKAKRKSKLVVFIRPTIIY